MIAQAQQDSENSSALANSAPADVRLAPPLLEVASVTLRYKTASHIVTATDRISFSVNQGDRLILLGPSGCGKSTLLKAIGGYIRPVEGRISLRGQEITRPGPDRGMVFQEFDQLLPWKTVKQNVAFALTSARGLKKQQAETIALEQLERVHLTKFANAYPHTLSGGMKQRVAIARCLALRPEIVLMDEPFAALDALTRERMQGEVLRLWEDQKFTLIFVTHSIPEAVTLGSRVLLLSPHPGRVRADMPINTSATDELRKLHDHIQGMLFDESIGYAI